MDLDAVLQQIVGPVGAIVVLCVSNFFSWRLFREEQKENRTNFSTVTTVTEAMKDLTAELRLRRKIKNGEDENA